MGEKIAFMPHKTKGKEIIKILEGMGGKNRFNLDGSKGVIAIDDKDFVPTISNDWDARALLMNGWKIYNLEDWETMKSLDKNFEDYEDMRAECDECHTVINFHEEDVRDGTYIVCPRCGKHIVLDAMSANNFKNGDVIVIDSLQNDNKMIAIFDRYGDDNALYIYIQMETSNDELFFNHNEWNFPYDMKKIQYRLATDLEKNRLYGALYKYFTEEYDCNWFLHFTDSSYFDILDCLLKVFCIKDDDDNFECPDFVQDIRNYIWDICCNVLGVKNDITEIEDEDKPKMVDIDKVKDWIFDTFYEDEHDGDYDYGQPYIVCTLDTMEKLLENFEKTMGD